MNDVFVLGRFPPPLDGQTIGTKRLAELLEAKYQVHRINTSPPGGEILPAEATFRPERVRHYAHLRGQIQRELQAKPEAPILWTSISPSRLGHWRDVLTVMPAFASTQPVFAVVHRATFHQLFQSRLTAPTAQRLVERVQRFVFLTEQLSESCAEWIPAAKRTVIPNTIDAELSCTRAEVAAKQDARRSRSELRLFWVGNMMPEKGYVDVLEAVRRLKADRVPATITFAGGWLAEKDRASFEQYVEAHRLREAVQHVGPVHDRARMKALYLDADVLLFPSYHPSEAQPIAVIEALNAGTPVVVTRQGGIPEMVTDQEAHFVPARDPKAIAKAVTTLADPDCWYRLSENARGRFEEAFSPEAVRSHWNVLLGEAVTHAL